MKHIQQRNKNETLKLIHPSLSLLEVHLQPLLHLIVERGWFPEVVACK
jgi:hypothetical protein